MIPFISIIVYISIYWFSIGYSGNPNIVWIWFDDLGFSDAGFNGGPYATPILDELHSSSIKLTQHYSEPVCSASRTAFLTGRYSWRTGLNSIINGDTNLTYNGNNEFFTENLKRYKSSYKTLWVGKAHIGYKFDDDQPQNKGFDQVVGQQVSHLEYYNRADFCATLQSFDDDFDVSDSVKTQRDDLFGDNFNLCAYDLFNEDGDNIYVGDQEYIERLYTNEINDFIEQYAETNPMFIYYSMFTPHFGIEEPPLFTGGIDGSGEEIDYSICENSTYPGNEPLLPNKQLFCRSMLYAQYMIQEIIDTLKENDIWDDTILVVNSDNGGGATGLVGVAYGQNLPLRGQKRGTFEGGIRVPAFITGGYIEDLLDKDGGSCIYNGLVHISDWFHIFLEILKVKDDNQDSDHHKLKIWKDIKKSCKNNEDESDDDDDDSEDDNDDNDGFCSDYSDGMSKKGRNELIYMIYCDHDPNSFLTVAYIRIGDWKLVVNGTGNSVVPCLIRPFPSDAASRAYGYIDSDNTFLTIPNEERYEITQNDLSSEIADLYQSDCYDELSSAQRSNESLAEFQYNELMLFHVGTDPIEACNLVYKCPNKALELLDILLDRGLNDYDGDGGNPQAINGGALLSRINTFDCDNNLTYYVPWEGVQQNLNDGDIIWNALIAKKNQCP